MDFETTIAIAAPREQVWSTLVDVERWPEWTASMKRVELLTGSPLRLASRVRIKQPRLQALEWDVTEFVPGEVFTWRSSTLGLLCEGSHRIVESQRESATAILTMHQTGFLAPLIGFLTARMTRRYVDMEARGLKARSEASVSSPES